MFPICHTAVTVRAFNFFVNHFTTTLRVFHLPRIFISAAFQSWKLRHHNIDQLIFLPKKANLGNHPPRDVVNHSPQQVKILHSFD